MSYAYATSLPFAGSRTRWEGGIDPSAYQGPVPACLTAEWQPAPVIRRVTNPRSESLRRTWERMTLEQRSARGRNAAARRLAVQPFESRSRGSKLAAASISPEMRSERARKASLARWAGHQRKCPCSRCGGPTQPYSGGRKRICKSKECRRAQRAERKAKEAK
jgi:hypothetical protein